tara:strand:+ start:22 stop:168 length:147 start_codon:yes stop_codon:yes gene_type:complete
MKYQVCINRSYSAPITTLNRWLKVWNQQAQAQAPVVKLTSDKRAEGII